VRVLVVDDEPQARKKLLRMLSAHADVEVVGEAGNGAAAAAALETLQPDVALLDVQMPDMDGFESLRRVRGPSTFRVVFVTAYDAFAVKAFEVHALDYLLKPVDPARFDVMLGRVRDALRAQSPGVAVRLLVTEGNRAFYVEVGSIDWLEADRNYVILHVGTRSHVVRGTLESFAAKLDPRLFVRVSRSHVVRREAIAELMPWAHGERQVVLADGTTLTWTRRYREPMTRHGRRTPVASAIRMSRTA
jgi:two-component system LytT family response regulator